MHRNRKHLAFWLFLSTVFSCSTLAAQPVLPKLILPVRVLLLSFDSAPELNHTYNKAQVEKLFVDVNQFWKAAGIEWKVLEVLPLKLSAQQFGPLAERETPPGLKAKLSSIAPPLSGNNLWQVAILHRFPIPAGGVYVSEKMTVFYGELNKNAEARPVVLAHELGHSLALRHVEDGTNLMAGGPKDANATLYLDESQIATARAQAAAGPLLRESMNPGERRMRQRNDGTDAFQRRRTMD